MNNMNNVNDMNYVNTAAPAAPAVKLTTSRGLLKLILLSIITLGIYEIWFLYSVKRDLNTVAGTHNGNRTMGLILLIILSCITFGIAPIVWFHKISNRIGREQVYRGIPQTISAASFWGWAVIGSIITIGPLVYMYKMCHSMNSICAHYNMYGTH